MPNSNAVPLNEKISQAQADLLVTQIREICHRKGLSEERLLQTLTDHFDKASQHEEQTAPRTLGERAADSIAAFGGSWPFIFLFLGVLIAWVILNSLILARYQKAFDPYPYILLNLFLSMLASLQAPVIMMSQNRQNARDRLDAQHDYAVNLKAEIEILALHQKLDELTLHHREMAFSQGQQIKMLIGLLAEKNSS